MTENEALELIEKDLKLHSKDLSSKYKNGLRMAIQALEEIQQYRAIGTVEEFKAFKLGRLGNKGFITIGQTMEEYAQEIRSKAIDEFAEKLNTDVESFEAEVNGIRADLLTLDYFSEFVFDVAEQMKGEQNG